MAADVHCSYQSVRARVHLSRGKMFQMRDSFNGKNVVHFVPLSLSPSRFRARLSLSIPHFLLQMLNQLLAGDFRSAEVLVAREFLVHAIAVTFNQ